MSEQQPVCVVCGEPATFRLCDDGRSSSWRWYCRTHGSNWLFQSRPDPARQQVTEDALALVARIAGISIHSNSLYYLPRDWIEQAQRIVAALTKTDQG